MKTYDELLLENKQLLLQLEEATETIHAIRSGQIDAIVIHDPELGHQLFTLKTADETYRVFIEKMSEGAVTLNQNGVILYSNSKFASMVNLELSKVIGLSFDVFVPLEDKDAYLEIFRNGWLGDHKTEISIRRDEKLIPCQLSVAALELDEGTSLSVILTDLSYQKEIQLLLKLNNKRLEDINLELESSNHDLQQFASVASHDLQEPLRKILIFSSMLKDKHREELSEPGATYLEKIISSSNRMKTMIVDVLSYSRLSTTDNNNFELTALSDIVDEVLDDYEILITEKNAEIHVDKLPSAEVNRGQIRQVFQNLISNSIKFCSPGERPVIRIRSGEAPSGECEIIFSDNGIGFDETYSEKIFSLFERLNTKDKYEGSGIGLAISKKIIDKHNGSISAESKDGQGAVFRIRLPLSQDSN